MFFITRGAEVVAYGSRAATAAISVPGDVPRAATLYGFSRLVLSQEACLAHVSGLGLLQLFQGTSLHGYGSGPVPLAMILLGDFDMLRTGRPDLLLPVFLAAGAGPAPKLATLVRGGLDLQQQLPA